MTRDVRLLAICHRHTSKPDVNCFECVTALETTHRAPLPVLIMLGLAGGWFWPERVTTIGAGS